MMRSEVLSLKQDEKTVWISEPSDWNEIAAISTRRYSDVYKDHPSAPAWTYTTNNVNDTASFEKAFERMVAEIRMTEKQ